MGKQRRTVGMGAGRCVLLLLILSAAAIAEAHEKKFIKNFVGSVLTKKLDTVKGTKYVLTTKGEENYKQAVEKAKSEKAATMPLPAPHDLKLIVAEPELTERGKEPLDRYYNPGSARSTGPYTMAGFGPEDQGGEGNIPPIIPPASEKIEDLDLFQKGIHVCREKFPADGALESHEVDPYLKALQAFKCDGKKCSDAQIKARAQTSPEFKLPQQGANVQPMYPVPPIFTKPLTRGDPQMP